MPNIERLPNSLTVQYSELLQNCVQPISDGSNISFKSKTINGKRYWYIYISLGSTRREHYLGAESTELLDRIEAERDARVSNEDDRKLRVRLVSMLVAGGMAATARDEGKLLTLLERSGVFLAGGVIVGTIAFRAYANMLGVRWSGNATTQEVDVAADNRMTLALPRPKEPIHLRQVILDSGMGFFEVPALDRRQPSTSFKVRRKDFRIDVLTPMHGREARQPVKIAAFDTYAQPMRYMDILLEDVQPAVLLHGHGIMINVPSPARFAMHKCVVSQMRPAADAIRARKDIQQADELFRVLVDNRPGDLVLARDAAEKAGSEFLARYRAGMKLLPDDIRQALDVFEQMQERARRATR